MKYLGRKINYCKVSICDIVVGGNSCRKQDVDCEECLYSQFSSTTSISTNSDKPQVMKQGALKLCVISDSHDEHEKLGTLPPCDILIHAGDICYKSRHLSNFKALEKLKEFNEWIGNQKATYKIVVGGNHDISLLNLSPNNGPDYKEHIDYIQKNVLTNAIYLCNSSVKLYNDSFTVVGSPMSVGQGSSNLAFQTRSFVAETYSYFRALAGEKTRVDLLVTHGPCDDIGTMIQPTLAHLYGHIHEHYGVVKIHKKVEDSNSHIVEYRTRLIESMERGMSVKPEDECEVVTMDDESAVETVGTSETGQNRIVYWHRVAASIMDENFYPCQLPILMEFVTSSDV